MPPSSIPKNETERLKILSEAAILDTLPEPRYDEMARLAALICGCPYAMITFVDRDRQWCKSVYGLEVKEAPRDGGFCARAILGSEPFVVGDANRDPLFSNHPFVTGTPHIRFYAGAPVAMGADLNVGVICVIDDKPRTLEPGQIDALKAFSQVLSGYLETRKKNAELEELLLYRKNSEKFLIHSAQMTALAQMSAGIAHEINNPLSVMLGHATALKRNLVEKDGQRSDGVATLDRIEKAGWRISKIIGGLRAFSRDAQFDPLVPCSIGAILEETLELCQARFVAAGVEMRIAEIPADLQIDCRAVQISQIFLNLLTNAFDAVVREPMKWIAIDHLIEEGKIHFRIRDSGPGIDPTHHQKIFEPFFTTKEVNQGTGLGLSICRGIAQSHGGEIHLDTASSDTSFVLTLPLRRT